MTEPEPPLQALHRARDAVAAAVNLQALPTPLIDVRTRASRRSPFDSSQVTDERKVKVRLPGACD